VFLIGKVRNYKIEPGFPDYITEEETWLSMEIVFILKMVETVEMCIY
jgi:hypothetical protein